MNFLCNECEKPFNFTKVESITVKGETIQNHVSPCCNSEDFEEMEGVAVSFEEDTLTEDNDEMGAYAMAGGNGLEDERPEDSY
jgi:hypothetical protein